MKTKTKVMIAVIAVILIGIIGVLVFLLLKKNEAPVIPIAETQNLVLDTSAENIDKANSELASRQVFFAGIGDGVIGREGSILLKNPESNKDIYMKYSVYNEDTGELVYETDLIESSKAVSWIPGETLPPGEYNFSFVEQPFYQTEGSDSWLPLTTGNNHVVIQIAE